jgi:hypothetical protein
MYYQVTPRGQVLILIKCCFLQDDETIRQAQQFQRTQKQQLLMVDSLGQLHHYVAPENIPGLNYQIHPLFLLVSAVSNGRDTKSC